MAKLTVKQQSFADEYIISKRVLSCFELSKRYIDMSNYITDNLITECIDVISSVEGTSTQKRAAKTILTIRYGAIKANRLIENIAVVIDRNDYLVQRWRKAIKERDKSCQLCSSTKYLEVHHT